MGGGQTTKSMSGRHHAIRLLDLGRELARREVQGRQLIGVDLDLDLAQRAADQLDGADPGHPDERGPDDALGDVAQPPHVGRGGPGHAEVPRDHRDRGRQHALDDRRGALRQLDVIDRGLAGVLRLQRIGLVRELERELGRAADRARAHVAHPRDHRERLLERARHLRLDEIRGDLAGVRDHDDAREHHLGIDPARQDEDRVHAERCERQDRDPHERGVAP